MNKNIIILAGILCMPILCASAYTNPECTLPIDVFKQYAKKTTYCDPATITKVAYYSGLRGWMVFGTQGNVNTCKLNFKSGTLNTDIDNAVECNGASTQLSTYTTLKEGVPYGCSSDSDCDSANGWVCQNKSSTYGVGICTQTGCGSNCQIGTGNWNIATSEPSYQERMITTCKTNTNTNTTYTNYACSRTLEGRCAPGAWGATPHVAPYSGCTPCPEWKQAYTTSALTTYVRGTSSAGSTVITDCYIPSNTSYYDATGTFKLTSNCSYK